jgi:hypothetical protein
MNTFSKIGALLSVLLIAVFVVFKDSNDKSDTNKDTTVKNSVLEYVKFTNNETSNSHDGSLKSLKNTQGMAKNLDDKELLKDQNTAQRSAYLAYQARVTQRNVMMQKESEIKKRHSFYAQKYKQDQLRIAAMMQKNEKYKEQQKHEMIYKNQLQYQNMIKTIEKNRALQNAKNS